MKAINILNQAHFELSNEFRKARQVRKIDDLLAALLRLDRVSRYVEQQEVVEEYPHASDCAVWVAESCDCITGR